MVKAIFAFVELVLKTKEDVTLATKEETSRGVAMRVF